MENWPLITIWLGDEGDQEISLVRGPDSCPLAAPEEQGQGLEPVIR